MIKTRRHFVYFSITVRNISFFVILATNMIYQIMQQHYIGYYQYHEYGEEKYVWEWTEFIGKINILITNKNCSVGHVLCHLIDFHWVIDQSDHISILRLVFGKKNFILKFIYFRCFIKDIFHYILSPNRLFIGVIKKVWGGGMWTCMESAWTQDWWLRHAFYTRINTGSGQKGSVIVARINTGSGQNRLRYKWI